MQPCNQQYWQLGKSVLECNKYMYETKIAADVCFTVDQTGNSPEEVEAHSYMLLSRSPVFQAMLAPMWQSSKGNGEEKTMKLIHIPDIQLDALKEILR